MVTPQHGGAPATARRWTPLALMGLVAVTAGIVLPQTLPTVPAAAPAVANESSATGKLTYVPPAVPDAPDPKTMLTKLGLATAAVLGLCVATLWLGRRWLGTPSSSNDGVSQLRLIESLALGNRCSIHLIHVANRPVLVGSDASGLKTVVPLPESFETALGGTILQDQETPESAEPSAARLYQRAMVGGAEPRVVAR